MNKPELSPFTRWLGEALLNHDDLAMQLFLLAASEFFWNETGNPVHAWEAIQICSDSKPELQLPSWAKRRTSARFFLGFLAFPKRKKAPDIC